MINKPVGDELPPGLNVGVIPPDGTQLELSVWMKLLGLHADEETAFKLRLNRDKIPHIGFCGVSYIDSTHIRRVIFQGRSNSTAEAD